MAKERCWEALPLRVSTLLYIWRFAISYTKLCECKDKEIIEILRCGIFTSIGNSPANQWTCGREDLPQQCVTMRVAPTFLGEECKEVHTTQSSDKNVGGESRYCIGSDQRWGAQVGDLGLRASLQAGWDLLATTSPFSIEEQGATERGNAAHSVLVCVAYLLRHVIGVGWCRVSWVYYRVRSLSLCVCCLAELYALVDRVGSIASHKECPLAGFR